MDEEIYARRATTADAEKIAEYNARLARETEGKELNMATTLDGVEAVLRNLCKGFYLLAEGRGDGVVGQLMATFEWSDWHNGWYWWIQSVYVDEAFRNRGLSQPSSPRLSGWPSPRETCAA